jgi:hypothetical protein
MTLSRTSATRAALGAGLALALAACGHADKASDAASADNVEIPAEEALSGLPAGVGPVADSADAGAPVQAPAPVQAQAASSGE